MKTVFSFAPVAAAVALLSLFSAPAQSAPAIYWEDDSFASAAPKAKGKAVRVRFEEKFEEEAQANTFDRNFPGFEDMGLDREELDREEIAARPARTVKRTPAVQSPRAGKETAAQKAQKILELVNGERTRHGLQPLAWDEKLAQAALNHSQDMVRRNYFSHFSPEGESVTERVVATGADWNALGENLASNVSVSSAHTALMNSLSHRRSILKPSYGRVGIGVVSSQGQIMVTQVFAN